MDEIWKDIIGYEGYYKVSNFGRVKSIYAMGGLILKQRKQNSGYLIVHLYKEKTREAKTVHRLVSKAFIPNPENKPHVNHLDGDKSNNKLDNLDWCTQSENIKHAYKYGITKRTKEWNKKIGDSQRGENSGSNILSKDDVIRIKEMIKKGLGDTEISKIIECGKSTIWNIRVGNSWVHV